MTRLNPKAILIAMLLSLTLDVVGGALLLAFFGAGFDDGLSADQITTSLKAIQQGSDFLLASLAYGTATTVFGGYVAARVARSYPYFNALAVGAAGILLGLVLSTDTPVWYDTLAYLISLPAALFGGHLAKQRNQ